MKKLICILFTCLLGTLLLAQNSAASICETKKTVIFFGNGVKSVKKDTYDSRNIIKQRLKAELPPEEFELVSSETLAELILKLTGATMRFAPSETIMLLVYCPALAGVPVIRPALSIAKPNGKLLVVKVSPMLSESLKCAANLMLSMACF